MLYERVFSRFQNR